MSELIAGGGAAGIFISQYTGPPRDDGTARRYQITRRTLDDLDGILTLSPAQLAELYAALDGLARASSAGLTPPPQPGPCTHTLPHPEFLTDGWAIVTWLENEYPGRNAQRMAAVLTALLDVLESVADAQKGTPAC